MADRDPNQTRREFEERFRDQIHADVYNRMQARMEWRYRHRTGAGGLAIGLFIAGVGVLLLLQNLGIFYIGDIWQYWPVILIAFGASRAASSWGTGGQVAGGIVAAIGVVFLLRNLGLIRGEIWNYFWPLILIAVGVGVLARGLDHNRAWSIPAAPMPDVPQADPTAPNGPATGPAAPLTGPGRVSAYAIFSGVRRRVDTQEFEGGEALAIFGGIKIDLRGAAMKQDQAVIDASALFGGIDIRVPDTWAVSVHGTGIFGGYEDATMGPPGPADKRPHLIITGFAMFGGVSVKS